MDVKRCPHCRQILPLAAFHVNHARRNSYQSWCKQCKADALRDSRLLRGPAPETIRVMPQWGEFRWNAKLTKADVILIRGLLPWLSCAEIARKFEVSRQCISDIKHGYSWYRLR